jgi:hypothetical protein
MPRSASVRLLDGKHRSVDLDACVVLATTNNPIVALAFDRLAARLAESHGGNQPALERGCALIPRSIHRHTDGLPFAGVTTALALLKEPPRSVFLEVPRDALADVLERGGFDAATVAEWTGGPPKLVVHKRTKGPRDRGLTARCLEEIRESFREHGRHPSLTDLKKRSGSKTLRSPATAYERFYRSDEYNRWIKNGGEPWGPKAPHR